MFNQWIYNATTVNNRTRSSLNWQKDQFEMSAQSQKHRRRKYTNTQSQLCCEENRLHCRQKVGASFKSADTSPSFLIVLCSQPAFISISPHRLHHRRVLLTKQYDFTPTIDPLVFTLHADATRAQTCKNLKKEREVKVSKCCTKRKGKWLQLTKGSEYHFLSV